jgi:hypothetical protein
MYKILLHAKQLNLTFRREALSRISTLVGS